ncbi:MAG: hypothetical protein JNN00_07150 [Chitinophagaceae bacterium]|nr:hypothetical protein [Chitinophagaceae bacterium]
MKIVIFIWLLFVSFFVSAQNELAKQLYTVISDSTNYFKSFRGAFIMLEDGDSVFASNSEIQGTRKNDIRVAKDMVLYRSVVADSIKERQGGKIIEHWKMDLEGILHDHFKVEKTKTVEWNPSKNGWKFMKGNILVNIDLYPYSISSSLYWVLLGITLFHSEQVLDE